MKKLVTFLVLSVFIFGFVSCGNSDDNANDETNDSLKIEDTQVIETTNNVVDEKTIEELIVGNWYDESVARGFDLALLEGGDLFWHSGTDEGEGTWEITDDGKLFFFGKAFEILELNSDFLKITDGEIETIYKRIGEE